MMELCALWQVDQTHTTPYHPQANGVVERGNRVLGDALRALTPPGSSTRFSAKARNFFNYC